MRNPSWSPVRIMEPTDEAVRAAGPSHETMIVSVLDAILDRHARDPAYPFVDTKVNIMTGEDFPPGPDPARDFKSKRVVYGWIQGRGLEALAGHAEWLPESRVLPESGKRNRVGRIDRMIRDVLEAMERLRARNGGRVPFMMTTQGQPLGVSDAGTLEPIALDPHLRGFGDLFYAKGVYAAARHLRLEGKCAEAEALLKDLLVRIETQGFATDQQPFDPKNKVRPVPGRKSQGPFMIGLFGIGLVAGAAASAEWFERGCRFIRHLLDHHVIHGRDSGLEPYDFVEAIDEAGRPGVDGGMIICDPGHAAECVGAMARFLREARRAGAGSVPDALFDECRRVLPRVLLHIFELAWNANAGGLCKTYDLAGRCPINGDLPWWSLPETLRAAALLLRLFPDLENAIEVRRVLAECSNALLFRAVNPRARLLAYQTRNARGDPVDVIPATPDADPGYHTGLAIIDFLRGISGDVNPAGETRDSD
jgi:hypothetical protein